MARFRTTQITHAPARRALDHFADFASVADWDPGISQAHLLSGEPGQVGARYQVTVTLGPRRIPLEYVVVDRVDPLESEPGHVVLVAEAGSFTSHDTITVSPTPTGTEVEYDAILTLHGLGRFMDWPMDRAFQVIGRRAEQGLRQALVDLADAEQAHPE